MAFSEVINGFFGVCAQNGLTYRVTVLGGKGVYVEGVERICELKPSCVSVLVKGGKIVFSGKNLSLGSYVDRDLCVCGLVEKIEWQK